MDLKRGPFQGVVNIVRFNWHFYLLGLLVILALIGICPLLPEWLKTLCEFVYTLALIATFVSLFISYLIYDQSKLYQLEWLPDLNGQQVLSVTAGFDEVSEILKSKSKSIHLSVCDFYDPHKHTELSIRRARKAYPPHSGTISVVTDSLPFSNHRFNYILAILSVHEIRDPEERITFFKELVRVLHPGGTIYVTEHLRDLPNFIAYTIGAFHFHSRSTWKATFEKAGLTIDREILNNPFIRTFILITNGDTP